jgi:hypothetical protein
MLLGWVGGLLTVLLSYLYISDWFRSKRCQRHGVFGRCGRCEEEIVEPKKDGTYRAIQKGPHCCNLGRVIHTSDSTRRGVVPKRNHKVRPSMIPSAIHECPLPDTISYI